MINCVIVDDEPLARERLASYVREVDFLHLSGTCENPLELITLLDQQPTDLILLDIQMPKMNGIDFLKIVQHPLFGCINTIWLPSVKQTVSKEMKSSSNRTASQSAEITAIRY